MRKSEEKRPGGGKRIKFDNDAAVGKDDQVVVVEERRKDGGKHVRFDRLITSTNPTPPSNAPPKEAKPK